MFRGNVGGGGLVVANRALREYIKKLTVSKGGGGGIRIIQSLGRGGSGLFYCNISYFSFFLFFFLPPR